MQKYISRSFIEYGDYLIQVFPDKFKKIEDCKTLTFYTGAQCTLRCKYCYENHDNLCEEPLTLERLKPFIDKLLDDQIPEVSTANTQGMIFEFIGGEPFMAIQAVSDITDYIFTSMVSKGHKWLKFTHISICSNGTLYFEPAVQEYIKKYRAFLSFSVSIDGHKELHDSCRVFPDGQGSFDCAIAAKRHFEKTYGGKVGNKLTFSHDNLPELSKAIKFMIDEGYTDIQANCVFEDVWKDGDNTLLYNQLCELADYIIENDLYNEVYISFFDEDLGKPKAPEDNNNWCGGVSKGMLAVNSRGELYTCIRFMECSLQGNQPPITLGDIDKGFYNTEEQRKNRDAMEAVTRRSQSTNECFNCPVAEGCAWCSAFNYQDTGSFNKRATYICPMHKARVYANAYYWQSLYNKLKLDKTYKCYLSEIDIENIKKGILVYPN